MAGGINPADAILDAVGEAEDRVDREGVDGGVESGVGLVVMPRQQLVEQVSEVVCVCVFFCGYAALVCCRWICCRQKVLHCC